MFTGNVRPWGEGRHNKKRQLSGRVGRLNCKLNKLERKQDRIMSRGARSRAVARLAYRIQKVRAQLELARRKPTDMESGTMKMEASDGTY